MDEMNHGRREIRKAVVVSAKSLVEQHEFPGLMGFGRIEATRDRRWQGDLRDAVLRFILATRAGGSASHLPRPLGHRECPALATLCVVSRRRRTQPQRQWIRQISPRARRCPSRHVQNVSVSQTQASRLGLRLLAQTSYLYINSLGQKRLPCHLSNPGSK
jgi:hypothetical protein